MGKAMDADPILADSWKTFRYVSATPQWMCRSLKLSICVGQSYRKNVQYALFQGRRPVVSDGFINTLKEEFKN